LARSAPIQPCRLADPPRWLRQPVSAEEAKRLISEQLPDELASVLSPDEAEAMRQKLAELSQPSARPRLTKRRCAERGRLCLLVFASMFPVVHPVPVHRRSPAALRLSNAVAIVMMFLCGYVFARCTGLRPWPTGLVMVASGCAMVGVAIALGG
jgi:VIT1/CCC1 family predicted Fe2+/Mn2+ transporter